MQNVPIRGESIDLDQFLKLCSAVGSGGEAKMAIQQGMVTVNGELETRRRKTLRPGDVVVLDGAAQPWRVTAEA